MTAYRDPTASLAEVEAATGRVINGAGKLTDADLLEPSPLPRWTRGHVLTHLARNADGLRNLLVWAATGVETPMYASPEARHADINAGAGRPAAEQLADLVGSAERFGTAATEVPEAHWSTIVKLRGGFPIPAWEIFVRRLREVEIHHVDLDVGYTPAHWPAEWVARSLPDIAEGLADREDYPALLLRCEDTDREIPVRPSAAAEATTVSGPEPALLAWLIGRSAGDGLGVEPTGTPLPALPKWG